MVSVFKPFVPSINKILKIGTFDNKSIRSKTEKIFKNKNSRSTYRLFENHWKSKFNIPDVEKEKKWVRKKAMKLIE